jgi:putative Mg2+ transporter-C (MgtC) family protein
MDADIAAQLDLLGRLALAVVLGTIVGVERELQNEEAGLRTHALVALGAALFTLVSSHAFRELEPDPTRIAAQIVTGIGFIGAGTILRGEAGVRGLSSAASVWAVGAMGMASGAGLPVLAVGGMLLALFVLEVLDRMEQAFLRSRAQRQRGETGPG